MGKCVARYAASLAMHLRYSKSGNLLKAEFGKARDAALKVAFDLEQIHEKKNYDFFVQAGVMLGVAGRFPRVILLWNQTQRGDCTSG